MYDILRPEWLETLPDATVGVYSDLTREIVQIIVKRIRMIGTLSRTDEIRLTNSMKYYGADINAIEKAIAKHLKRSEAEVDNVFKEVAQRNNEFAEQFYRYRNMTPKLVENERLLADQVNFITERTKQQIGTNLANTMAFKGFDGHFHNIRETYLRTVDRAIYEVQAGTIDYDTAIKQAVRNLAGGIESVQWDNIIGVDDEGNPIYYHRRLDSQVRQNILDGIRQANQVIMDYNGKAFGADGVELTAHALSAPDHAPVQGRQFSNEEFERMQSGLSSTDYEGNEHEAFDRPIGEWNCRHFAIPIVLGVSQQFYTEEQLEEMEHNSAQKYPAKQKQRRMEAELRKMKEEYNMLKTAGMDDEARALKDKINIKQKALRIFCKEQGIEYEPNRARPY